MHTIYYSTNILLKNENIIETVDMLTAEGANCIELFMEGPLWEDMLNAQNVQVLQSLKQKEITYGVHPPAYDINITSDYKEIRDGSMEVYKRSIEIAAELNATYVVIHPGFLTSPASNVAVAQRRSLLAIEQLCEVAESLNVLLGIENVGYNGKEILNEMEFVHFLNDLPKTAKYVLDTGHAHVNKWNIPGVIEKIADRIVAIHLHDNDQKDDLHLPLNYGTIKWESVIDILKNIKQQFNLVLEYKPNTDTKYLGESLTYLKQYKVLK